ncbi:restriction endonuclease subunit R [Vibrio splendidus]|uniref:DEAD/DEAH box helicase n=1 Tax=Vibrio splendidus TaxID=29497 RepID=UPI000D34D65E|nr:DEAD/DEAH box helicase family protein [Vibrio splendidus]PTQ16483.1 restriction endonuclease subunit R [Vibrio splendidus]
MKVKGFKVNDMLWNSLRACQKDSIETGFEYLRRSVATDMKSCLISLPTGAGKSGVITILSHKATQKKTLILCHRRAVCDQLFKEINGKFFSDRVSGETIPQKTVYNSIDDISNNGVYVTTFQKLQTLNRDQLANLKASIDLLMIDEGHSEPSPVWKNLVRGMGAHKIVITATPYRNDLFQFDVDATASYIYTFEQALEDRVLNEPSFHTISEDNLIANVSIFFEQNHDAKCIIKCKNVEDIEKYYTLFNDVFSTLAIHEQFKNDPRANAKVNVPSNLKDSSYKIIIHQKKLDEGVDIPQAKLLILTYIVGSGRELVQTIGRVVRLYNELQPQVLEINNSSNNLMWQNYRHFDRSLSSSSSAEKFTASLDTSRLIESYLESFPEASYYGKSFMRKFDLNRFNPTSSLSIPTASVCFLEKKDGFSSELFSDTMYWRSNASGELVKQFESPLGMRIVVSIAFNRSRFLINEFFFEPSLEVLLVKELDSGLVAIYDSRGRRFNYDSDLKLGAGVSQDKLVNVMGLGESVRTKEASSRAINSARKRPESVFVKGANLEDIADYQANSSYRISTMKCDTFDRIGDKTGSYYLGIDSGRISDQKDSNFTLEELDDWLTCMDSVLISHNQIENQLLQSYAKPVLVNTSANIECIIMDFSENSSPIILEIEGLQRELDNNFLYFPCENNNFKLFEDIPESIISIELIDESPFIRLSGSSLIEEIGYGDLSILEVLANNIHKALLDNGVSYSNGQFYEWKLPSQNGFSLPNSPLSNVIIGLTELTGPNLDEKGLESGEYQVVNDGFSPSSVFYLLDQIKEYSNPNPTLRSLGPFGQYIPQADIVLNSDMGTEPADFILSSPTKLVYVHVKCRDKTNPRSSAGGLAEVGSQAIKNIEMLISSNTELRAGNWGNLNSKWPKPTANQVIEERIRMFNQERFNSGDDDTMREQGLTELWNVISERRKSNQVQKEIWIVSANSFSANDFNTQLNRGNLARPESLQAYQLIQSWLSISNSNDVELKIFVSP